MKRIILHYCSISILWGALFFLCPAGFSSPVKSVNDSLSSLHSAPGIPPDSIIDTPPDTILQLPNRGKPRQNIDTARYSDTLTLDKKKKEKLLPSPHRATILSAVLPGLGQAYNGKYWKIPIVYAGGAGLYVWYHESNWRYEKYFDLYQNAPDTDTKNYYERYKNAYSKQRSYAVIFMGIWYLANVVDAMTDAYFLQYDISDDLNLELSPTVEINPFLPGDIYPAGVKLSLNF